MNLTPQLSFRATDLSLPSFHQSFRSLSRIDVLAVELRIRAEHTNRLVCNGVKPPLRTDAISPACGCPARRDRSQPLRFEFLRAVNIPTGMYANPPGRHKSSCAHLAPVLRRYLSQNPCFGRFLGQLSRSDAWHEFSNHVRLLTALVRSSPISRRPWSVLKPMRPMVIRMLLQMSCACGESSIFED